MGTGDYAISFVVTDKGHKSLYEPDLKIVFRHPSLDRCIQHLCQITKGFSCSNPDRDPRFHFNYYVSSDRSKLYYQEGYWTEGCDGDGVYPKTVGYYQIEQTTFGAYFTEAPSAVMPRIPIKIPVGGHDLPSSKCKKKKRDRDELCRCGCRIPPKAA